MTLRQLLRSNALRHAALVLLALSVLALAVATHLMFRSLNKIDLEHRIISSTERFLSTLKDHETGFRGFIITGAERFLEPYHEAQKNLPAQIAELRDLAQIKAVDADAIERLLADAQKRIAVSGETIRLYTDVSPQAAQFAVGQGTGQDHMDAVRADADAIRANSSRQIMQTHDGVLAISRILIVISVLLTTLTSMFLVYLGVIARRQNLRSQKLLGDVLNAAPVGLALMTARGRVVIANPSFAQLAGSDTDSVNGKKLEDISPAIHESISKARIALSMEIGNRADNAIDQAIDLIDGTDTQHLKATVFPVILEQSDGSTGAGVGIVLDDVTRQRTWEREVQEARHSAEASNRAKSAFIANMSHELRTPLTAVLDYCELLDEEIRDIGQEELLGDVNKIHINARHLLGLINDVLDLSKIEARKMDVHPVRIELRHLLDDIEAAVGGLVTKNNNRFTADFFQSPPEMFTDDLKIKQILLNLIGNAAKFTQDGVITLSASEHNESGIDCIRFQVKDTGIGMTSEQMSRLFERFSQADSTTTRTFGGTGLGLALTRALTDMLGGKISVESEIEKGSTFSVTIPKTYIKKAEFPEESISDMRSPLSAEVTDGTILVVEDDPAARDIVVRHLTREGFSVSIASDGQEAIFKARQLKPIAILLDVMLPVVDGWHVLRTLREDPETAEIPIIMQTVLDEEHFAYALGATSYLRKPIDRLRLSEALNGIALNPAGKSVLIVDDDSSSRDRVTRMFKRDGWNVVSAGNGQQAIEAMELAQPTLILVDLVMPEMDGYKFIKTIRQNELWNDIPVVVLTAQDIHLEKVQKLAATTSGIVQKGSLPLADLVADLRRFKNSRTRPPVDAAAVLQAQTVNSEEVET